MAAGEAVPPHQVDCADGSASLLASAPNNPVSQSVELPPSYSTVVQSHLLGQPPSSSVLTQTLHPNVWLADDIQKLKPFSIILGKPSFSFSTSEKHQLVHNIKHVLIGKFSHGRPPMASIKKFFANLNLQGECNLSSFDSKHIYIECSNSRDFYRIWMNLVWNIKGYPMRVFQWSCEFSPRCESPLAPVWIRLEGIPLYLFDKMSLLSIANSIGKPICIDPRNLNRSMLNCALVCVELDVSKQLTNEVWIGFKDDTSGVSLGGFWVQVFYDFVPHFCSSCCHIGHSSASCKSRQQTDLVGVSSLVSCEAPQQGGLACADLSPSQCTKSLGLPNLVSCKLVEKRQASLIKDIVNHEVEGAQLQPSSVWIPANKRKVPSSKGKDGKDQEQALDMSNRFGVLAQQQVVSCSLNEADHPVSVEVTPTGLGSLNELHEERPTNGTSRELGSQQQVALHTLKAVSMVSLGNIGSTDKQQANKNVVDALSRNSAEVLGSAEMVQPTPSVKLSTSNTKGEVQILNMLSPNLAKPVRVAPLRQQVHAIENSSEQNPVQVDLDVLAGNTINVGIQVAAKPATLLSQDRAESIEYPTSGLNTSKGPSSIISHSWSDSPATRTEGPESHDEAKPIQTTSSDDKQAGKAEQEDTGSDRIFVTDTPTSPVLLVEGAVQQIAEGGKLKGQRGRMKAEGEVKQIAETPLQEAEQAAEGSGCESDTSRFHQQPQDIQTTTSVKFNQLKFCDEVEQRKNKLHKGGRSKDHKATKVMRSPKGILHRDGYWCDPDAIDEPWFQPYTRRLPKKVKQELGIF